MHTHFFGKKMNGMLHRFAATFTNFGKIDYFRLALLHNVHVYRFSAKSG